MICKVDVNTDQHLKPIQNLVRIMIRMYSSSTRILEPNSKKLTTVLFGGSNATATLCSILGDGRQPQNHGHTVRVVTNSLDRFTNPKTGDPFEWECQEQVSLFESFPLSFFPTSWKTHRGAPDGIFPYDQVAEAISGENVSDEGAFADALVLACPVHAHFDILRSIARALYHLNDKGLNQNNANTNRNQDHSSNVSYEEKPPLLVGTLYAGGNFDWMARMAFLMEKSESFDGSWSGLGRPLALFGLKSFPYLCKSSEVGSSTLYGRFPGHPIALAPFTPRARTQARKILSKILQCEDEPHKLKFLCLEGEKYFLNDAYTNNEGDERTIGDMVDPFSSLPFIGCTLTASNQYLHPVMIDNLFPALTTRSHLKTDKEPFDADGFITWNNRGPAPLLYGDGASSRRKTKSLLKLVVCELYPLLHALDKNLSPQGTQPISHQHGGDPIARIVSNILCNDPKNIACRLSVQKKNLLVHVVADKQQSTSRRNMDKYDTVQYAGIMEFATFLALSENIRLRSVVTPVVPHLQEPAKIRPDIRSRLFLDDIPHGLCVLLGYAELLGLDIEKEFPYALYLTRRFQKWMGKEYIQPDRNESDKNERHLVAHARDLHETSAPQAFGVTTLDQLREFLRLSPTGDNKKSGNAPPFLTKSPFYRASAAQEVRR